MIGFRMDNGVAVLTIAAGERVNLATPAFAQALLEKIQKLSADGSLKGVVLCSERKEFLVGADPAWLSSQNAANVEAYAKTWQAALAALEKLGKPVVSLIAGSALSAGLDLCLASHRRLAVDDGRIQLGFPDVTMGLLPCGGGVGRLVRTVGVQAALPLILEGRNLNPRKAKDAGLVDELVAKDSLMASAMAWIVANPSATQPWDSPKYKMPGGGPESPRVAQTFSASSAMVAAKTHGNYPAPRLALSAVYQSIQLPFERAIAVERGFCVQASQTREARLMSRTFSTSMQELAALGAKDTDATPKKVAVLGAGMMGQGIAYVSAMAGVPVVLKDISKERAEAGKAYADGLLKAAVAKGASTEEERQTRLGFISTSDDPKAAAGCDLVIEAVIEDRAIKAAVTAESEAVMVPDGIFASNTSTLPITGLATKSKRPENFIGLHFFSPVEKMPLVEIIMGEKTGKAALAKCLAYVRKLKKTPIVVNDGRGFYTSRVFTAYVSEGIQCLAQGINPALIENAAKKAGMAVGPLTVADEVSLELMHHVFKQTMADLGPQSVDQTVFGIFDKFLHTLKRPGRKGGQGFYDYPAGAEKHLWTGLAEHFEPLATQPSAEEVGRRFLTVQAIEACRAMDEKVLTCARDGDVGSVLGWGFPAYTGGCLSYIEWRGLGKFVDDCAYFEKVAGKRFTAPASLLARRERGAVGLY